MSLKDSGRLTLSDEADTVSDSSGVAGEESGESDISVSSGTEVSSNPAVTSSLDDVHVASGSVSLKQNQLSLSILIYLN